MAEEYSRAIAKVVVAQITADAGFEAVQQSALDALADVLLRCLGGLGAGTRAFAELAGRTDCNINDLLLAFEELGINVTELPAYVDKQDATPFDRPVPSYPVSKRPRARSSFAAKQEAPLPHIPPHLPAFPAPHAFADTPVFAGHETDPVKQRLLADKARRQSEKALVCMSQRAEGDITGASTSKSLSEVEWLPAEAAAPSATGLPPLGAFSLSDSPGRLGRARLAAPPGFEGEDAFEKAGAEAPADGSRRRTGKGQRAANVARAAEILEAGAAAMDLEPPE